MSINHVNKNIFMLFTITGFIILALLIYSLRLFSKSQLTKKEEEIIQMPLITQNCALKKPDDFKGYEAP
jgi:uncharacterized protein YpmB